MYLTLYNMFMFVINIIFNKYVPNNEIMISGSRIINVRVLHITVHIIILCFVRVHYYYYIIYYIIILYFGRLHDYNAAV